jgi:hypothetical protein
MTALIQMLQISHAERRFVCLPSRFSAARYHARWRKSSGKIKRTGQSEEKLAKSAGTAEISHSAQHHFFMVVELKIQ